MKFARATFHALAAIGLAWMAADEIMVAIRSVRDPWDKALAEEAQRVKADVGEVKES